MDKDKLIEKYRYINVEHDWWDCTYDFFKEDMSEVGIEVGDIHFSGFYCQGDYASFSGRVHARDMTKFLTKHGLLTKYPAARYFAESEELDIKITESHRYGRMEVSLENYIQLVDVGDHADIRQVVLSTMSDIYYATEEDNLYQDVRRIIDDYATKLFKTLESEYEDLTSDDGVWDTIVANELDKDEEVDE